MGLTRMDALIAYFERNAVDIMFWLALVAVIYTIARLLKAGPGIALTAALLPLIVAWAHSNGAVRHLLMSHIY